jgi:hypothetical protein
MIQEEQAVGCPHVSEVDMKQTATGNEVDIMWVETLMHGFHFVIPRTLGQAFGSH